MRGDSMTKTLQEIQEFNRRKIICAINGTENYQEALKLEYAEKGNNTISVPLREYEGEDLTLDRVLIALKNYEIGFIEDSLCYCKHQDFYEYDIRELCNWDLTKSTGENLELEEQSEETQRAIYELLGGENE